MKINFFATYAIFICITSMLTFAGEETKRPEHEPAITTVIHNDGNWSEENINNIKNKFMNKYKNAHSEITPLSLHLTTRNGRNVRDSDGIIRSEAHYLKVVVLVGERIVKEEFCEVHQEKIRSFSK